MQNPIPKSWHIPSQGIGAPRGFDALPTPDRAAALIMRGSLFDLIWGGRRDRARPPHLFTPQRTPS